MEKKKPRCRTITKDPVQLAQIALSSAEVALPRYSCSKSRKDFTQSQLFAILVLKAFFKTDHRGIVDYLESLSDLRSALGLRKVPHFSALWYAERRLIKGGPSKFFKKPSLIDTRIWRLLEKSPLGLLTPQDSNLDTLLDIIGSGVEIHLIEISPEDGPRSPS